MANDTISAQAVTAHDEGAEKAVLGIMLLDSDATAEARRRLNVEDFYNPLHQAIFATACKLDDDRSPVEPTSILSELTRSGEAKNASETALYLTEIFSNAPAPASLQHYASLVRDAATRRGLASVGMKMQQMAALDGVENPTEIVERMRETLDNLAVDRLGSDIPLADEIVSATLDEIDALSKGGVVMGCPTGFSELDVALNGLRPGQMIVVAARPGVGKALALDTKIPTPTGWTTMGELNVGDKVLGRDGKATTVTGVTGVMLNRDCYEVKFSDGSTIIADAEHQWATDTLAERKSRRARKAPLGKVIKDSVTTLDILNTLMADGKTNHAVRVAEAIELPEAELPIDPYVLGAWLGDGNSRKANIYSADPEILDEIRKAGYLVNKTAGKDPYEYTILKHPARNKADKARVCINCDENFTAATSAQVHCSLECAAETRTNVARGTRFRVQELNTCDICEKEFEGFVGGRCNVCIKESFKTELVDANLIMNKHIPSGYLRASIKQRRDLLAGLLDTDGGAFASGRAEYYTTSTQLKNDVYELIVSLGYRAQVRTKQVKGRTEQSSTAYTISFTPGHNVFRLSRKAEKLALRSSSLSDERLAYRYIVSVTPVDSVPVKCISVDNEEHLYLAGESMIPTHNTAFALDIIRHAAFRQSKSVMMFSLEMSRNELMMRALAAEAYVDLGSLKTGDLDEHKWQQLASATRRMYGSKLGVDDTATVTMTDIRAKARAFQRVHGLDLLVIDYIQLMNSDRKTDSRQQEVSDISRGIKLLAKEFGIPVIALSQLNRGSEQRQDKKPVISDLRESGAIEQDADVVILLHREEIYEKESPRAGEADVIVAKQRSGPTGTIILSWLGKYSRFDNRTIQG